VEGLLSQAISEFETILHRESKKYKNFTTKVVIDSKKFIPEDKIGGIILLAAKSKIMVDNTLDKRLDLLKQSAIPEIRKLLFKNSN
jgi:V-type H+-transporting ATPase subunit E